MNTSASTRARSSDCRSGVAENKIGEKGAFVRALNFSGSAFDTVMQLGVAHALLVIQGRAPDIITGVSAGAIQAAAVAEILQAGEQAEKEKLQIKDSENTEKGAKEQRRQKWLQLSAEEQIEIQELRLHARVSRLREFAGAVQRAPEEVLDALLPDAYQIDEREHLEPLIRPLDSNIERKARRETLSARAGLVTLYNELLGLPLSIGTITRIVRRILGLKGTREIRGVGARWFARATEAVPLWVLIGRKLPKFSRVLGLAVKAYWVKLKRALLDLACGIYELVSYPCPWRDRGTDARTIISRFRTLHYVSRRIFDLLAFTHLLLLWLAVSWAVLLLPALLAHAIFVSGDWFDVFVRDETLVWIIGTAYFIVLLSVLWPLVKQFVNEPSSFFRAAAMVFALGGLIVFWTTVLLGLITLARMLIVPDLVASATGGIVAILPDWFDKDSSILDHIGWGWTVVAFAAILITPIWLCRRDFPKTFLKSHDLDKSLVQSHPLEVILAELFDPDYYGQPTMSKVIESSLTDEQKPSEHATEDELEKMRRKVARYDDRERLEPITLGLAVANIATRAVHDVPPDESIVKALLTATAITPLFPARKLKRCSTTGGEDPDKCKDLYVDAARLITQPTRVLFKMLGDRKHPESDVLHMYNVAPIPLSGDELGEEPDQEHKNGAPPYLNLVDVVLRAISLQQFRDAQLERQLTERYTRSIPRGIPNVELPAREGVEEEPRSICRAWVTPVESDVPLRLNRRILSTGKHDRRDAISQTIADGCRASLEVMTRESLPDGWEGDVRCGAAVTEHLKKRTKKTRCANGSANDLLASLTLPGCEKDKSQSPGLPEICKHCKLASKNQGPELKQHLRLRLFDRIGPAWPHERESEPDFEEGDPHFETEQERKRLERLSTRKAVPYDGFADVEITAGPHHARITRSTRIRMSPERRPAKSLRPWPSDNNSDRPTVSLLFSGGVFRGVYQMGVVNALNVLGIKPDLIAGASVGSITAAMVAKVFSEKDLEKRRSNIAELASVYLTLDKIMLTDRFSDFVRELTIRAAQTNFSINDADHLFRKYDHNNSIRFTRRARNVVAGIERLFYVNPFQLRKLVYASRNRNSAAALKQVQSYVQQWLDRMQVGKQLLGAEPLRLLIDHYVLDFPEGDKAHARTPVPIDTFLKQSQIAFLATATNLTAGKLEVLGDDQRETTDLPWQRPALREALLVSSAFPGVFRPRWSWELRPTSCDEAQAQFMDGGTIDNLPIQPTVDFLAKAAADGQTTFRPRAAGHLILAASLRSDPEADNARNGAGGPEPYWPTLNRQAGRLKYNKKIDTYGKAASDLRRIWEYFKDQPIDDSDGRVNLLDLEVVTVKPNWTCGTFGFHPMLGFRRENQARSIAHGCSTTLIKMGELERRVGADSVRAWGINHEALPTGEHHEFPKSKREWKSIQRTDGKCWLNNDIQCPFSKQALHDKLGEGTVEELAGIYDCCQTRDAHFT